MFSLFLWKFDVLFLLITFVMHNYNFEF